MGMAATQGILLQLTWRKHDITGQEHRLTNQKDELTREMQAVSQTYQNAINSKVYKWSNNSGVSYIDLTYSNLMTPSEMNQYTPYMLTDSNGKVVIDNNYKQYAEMISSDGASGGDYESVRTDILSSLTGIDPSAIESSDTYSQNVSDSYATLSDLISSEPNKSKFESKGIENLLGKMDTVSKGYFDDNSITSWQKAYSSDATKKVSSASDLKEITDSLENTLGKYFMDDEDNFKEAIEAFYEEYSTAISNGDDYTSNSTDVLTGPDKNGNYEIHVTEMLDYIMGKYTGDKTTNSYTNEDEIVWYDLDSTAYTNYQTEHDEWQTEYDAAKDEYDNAVNVSNSLLTADQEKQIDFYDAIFSSIADNGWTYNNHVTDTDYLNQMLQNNTYTITTAETSRDYDSTKGKYVWDNEYSTDIASNCNYIYSVNDSEANSVALAEYEYQKSIINSKESRIDTRLDNLETELSAINSMMESAEKIIDNNVDTNFGIFA